MPESDCILKLSVNGELDLHTFHPAGCKDLAPEYLQSCRDNCILTVFILYGKEVRRQTAHRVLGLLPAVMQYYQASDDAGG
jgi:hypothetical protein